KLRAFTRLRPHGPFLMVAGAAALVMLPPLWPLAPLAAATYSFVTGVEAVRVSRELDAMTIPFVWACLPRIHASRGIGFAAGLWKYLRAPDWPAEPERVPPRRVVLRAV